MKITNTREVREVISFCAIRRIIGYLRIGLPFALWIMAAVLGCRQQQPSISHCYYTMAGSLFVGVLCAVGLFLISYKGFGSHDGARTRLTCFSSLLADS